MISDDSKYLVIMFATMFTLPALAALFLPKFGSYGLLFVVPAVVGIAMVLFSKIRLKIRTRQAVEYGTKGMSTKEKVIYIGGYSLMTFSLVFLILGLSSNK